jgi:hypothetical protein
MYKPALATALATALVLGPLAVAAQAAAGTATVVPAQWGQRRAIERDRYRHVYQQGYDAGRREAIRDARSRHGGDYRRLDAYRRGWRGPAPELNAYRQGFADGYRASFAQAARAWRRPYPGPRPGIGHGYSPAAQRGFEAGYREGLKAARSNDRYDPRREKKYRQGDDGYNRRYGSRDRYKQEYRAAFEAGYNRGYREGRWR